MILESSILEKVFLQSRIPQMIFQQDFINNIANNAFFQFIGYTEEEWRKISVQEISHPEDYELDLQLFRDMLTGLRDSYQLEKRYFHKNGEIIWGSLNVTLIEDSYSEKKYFLAQVLDITEEKNLEQVLTKNEQKYRLLAENSSDIINLHLKDGQFIYNSPSIKQILGYEAAELLGDKPSDYIHPDDLSLIKEKHTYLINHQGPLLISYRARNKNGTYIPLESSVKSVFDEKTGLVTGFISITRDIRSRVEQDILLRKSEKLAVVGQLAAAVAHEIRNPLTSIKGFMQLFYSTKECNEELINVAFSEINRVEEIISEFLTLARPHQEKKEPIKVHDLMKQVVQLLQAQAILINKEIKCKIEEDIPVMYGDPNALKQVFFNIIQNGLDAIDERGFVIIKITSSDQSIRIDFIDNGRGIPKERLQRIAEPFYSTTEKGTGFGLLTSYKTVENHNGKLEIDSTVGIGTTVTIFLPNASN
ncbi:PAS domain S-box protein [Metabacillus litoralis]|uniref:histidine kinase n=1 Tax=Metabacillus litoralis TaxID=152268 RepID=A0A5C6W5G6_9BACI|nr:PAS domain S-box protein [Metabacillus litoralis]TXC91785.1 PAS domain S-box protein [Metabacillus litoralis]